MPYKLAADNFHTKKLYTVADFLQANCDFRGKTAVLRLATFGGLRGNIR